MFKTGYAFCTAKSLAEKSRSRGGHFLESVIAAVDVNTRWRVLMALREASDILLPVFYRKLPVPEVPGKPSRWPGAVTGIENVDERLEPKEK